MAGPFVCASCGQPTATSFRCRDCFAADRHRETEKRRARQAERDAERRRAERIAAERAFCTARAVVCLELQQWAADHGRVPRWRELPAIGERARRLGWTWREALAAAKLDSGPWDADRIVDALQADAERRGRPPTHGEWRKADPARRRPTASHVKHVFGRWSAALKAAGIAR